MNNEYTEEQIEFVKLNVCNPEKVLTNMFNDKFCTSRSVTSIRNLKHRLGIKSGLKGGQFTKGQAAYNKGKKWDEYISKESQEKSRKTCFKKGNIPANHRPVGSERFSKDGYFEIKIAEPNKWVLKHKWLYENKYGKIPKGYAIVFTNQNKLDCSLENLRLIKRSELLIMNRNRFFNENREITNAYINVAQIVSKTNEMKR